MRRRNHHFTALLVAAILALGATSVAAGPLDPLIPSESTTTTTQPPAATTSTTAAPGSTTPTTTATTTPPGGGGSSQPPPPVPGLDGGQSTPAPPGASTGEDGDGTAPPAGRPGIPPEAKRIMDSVVRSGPSNNSDLNDAMSQLVELGLTPEQAYKVGFGRFIIAGPTNYTHDWLFPRYGPGLRFHLGLDVFAPYGTPVRAPVDGTATASNNSLGGLAAKVYMEDGTYFYLAHLSAVPESMVSGEPIEVEAGDIVGFVGDSGNAKGTSPHVHLGVYPQGGAAIDPKPILDGFLDDARARFPEVLAYYQQQAGLPATSQAVQADLSSDAPTMRGLLSTELLRPFTSPPIPPGVISTEALFASTANPTGGALRLAEAEAEHAAASIDWEERQFLDELRLDVLGRGETLLQRSLAPFASDADSDAISRAVVRGGAG